MKIVLLAIFHCTQVDHDRVDRLPVEIECSVHRAMLQ